MSSLRQISERNLIVDCRQDRSYRGMVTIQDKMGHITSDHNSYISANSRMEGEPVRCRFRLLSVVEGPDEPVLLTFVVLGPSLAPGMNQMAHFVLNRCHTPTSVRFLTFGVVTPISNYAT
jgi:hypothetical protein